MKKVLLISASPRKGNSDFIVNKIYEKLNLKKELIFLRDKEIQFCKGCLYCHKTFQCSIKDDMNELNKKLLNTDIIVIVTPNYFDNVSALLKNFIDRTHPFYKSELLKNKKLILIMVGGGKIKGTLDYLNYSMFGFTKYLKLDLIASYGFQALNINDLKNDNTQILEINKIIKKIENN